MAVEVRRAHPFHFEVANLLRRTYSGLMTSGADKLRTETRLRMRAAQDGDTDITVLSPLSREDMLLQAESGFVYDLFVSFQCGQSRSSDAGIQF